MKPKTISYRVCVPARLEGTEIDSARFPNYVDALAAMAVVADVHECEIGELAVITTSDDANTTFLVIRLAWNGK